MRQQLAGLGCDESRIVVHHLGADCRRMSLIPRHAGPDRVVCIVTVARFVEKKGLEYAIRAVAELVHSGIRLEYSIIGDGPLFGQMQRLIREQRVGHCVQLLGWKNQDEVAEILGDADIFLAPSVTASDGDEEGTPTVLVEAMARGLPVVSTYHSAIPEMVIDGVSGFLVPERDVDALAERLTYLIENPQIWPEMGRKGRAFVEQHFDINKLNDQLVNLYQRMTEER